MLTLASHATAAPTAAADPAAPFAAFPDAAASDPVKMGWMVGSPPPPERTVRFADGSFWRFPAFRWTVAHMRQLMPTVVVSRGVGAPSRLDYALRDDLDAVPFQVLGSPRQMGWGESLVATYTDGVVVLHRGRVVYERYFGALKPEGQHAAMSITKTFVGTLAASLVAEGKLDPQQRVDHYVPELAASAFGSATLRQLMDMTTGIKYSEDYTDPKAEVWLHGAAGNPLPKPKDYTGPRSHHEFLQTVQAQGEHGAGFGYRTANTDALGWVLARVTGRSVAELMSERLWQPMGAEQDAYLSVDAVGTPSAGGGLSLGLRDLARFGELMRNHGRWQGRQIVPSAVVDDIRKGGSRADFAKGNYPLLAGWSYRNMWWVTHNPHGAFMARGVHGQALYVDPTAEMVIARFASAPLAGNAALDPLSLPAYQALAQHLMRAPR